MSNLIFNVHENYIEIATVSKIFNIVKIKNIINFTPVSNDEDNNIKFNSLLTENKITSKKVDVILSIESIITRQIEVPEMKKKDLENFINNNISDYFTVNTDDFYFDYKIDEIRKEEKKKIFSVILVAVSKEKLDSIKILLKLNEIDINKVKIYPECLIGYYRKNRKQSIAVLDVGNDKSSVTITTKGKMFIYSTLFLESNDVDYYSEIIDNFNYFLNFYSTRNFSNKVDEIYVVGEKSKDAKLIKALRENVDTNITYEMDNNYVEILGSLMQGRAIHNKSIEFKKALNDKLEDKGFIPIIAGILLIAGLGIGTYYYNAVYLNKNKNVEHALVLSEIDEYSGVEKELSDLNIKKQDYQKKVDIINEVKNDEFNYVSIIDGIKNGLPKNITLKSIDIKRGKTSVILNINNSTLDAARAVIAINNTKLFETVDISEVKLDNVVSSLSLELIPKILAENGISNE